MKIIVDNKVIETQNIIEIEEIEEFMLLRGQRYRVENSLKDRADYIGGFTFYIQGIQDGVCQYINHFTRIQTKDIPLLKAKSSLSELRNKVIEMWEKDKIQIPILC